MIRTRHRLLASLAAVVALAVAAEASAQNSLLVLSYTQAKTFGNVHIAGGAIDLTGGSMIVTTSSFGFVPSGGQSNERGTPGVAEFGDNAIHDALQEGQNLAGGFWNGTNGIISSTAANDPNTITSVGWVDNSILGYTIFNGVPVTTNQSIIATTWWGDSLLTGQVTADDYSLWLGTITNPAGANKSTFTGGPVEWLDADWLPDGLVTADDYSIWLGSITSPAMHALNFNPSAPGVPGGSAAATAVPEPTSALLLLAMLPCAYLVRRLRRSST
jgi:hypothetical protein